MLDSFYKKAIIRNTDTDGALAQLVRAVES